MVPEVLPEVFVSKAVIGTLPLVIGDKTITEDYNQESTRELAKGGLRMQC